MLKVQIKSTANVAFLPQIFLDSLINQEKAKEDLNLLTHFISSNFVANAMFSHNSYIIDIMSRQLSYSLMLDPETPLSFL